MFLLGEPSEGCIEGFLHDQREESFSYAEVGNACRIVYLVEEAGEVHLYGFAYGTLPGHAERGEERYTVEWNRPDDSVWYDLYAFSRPRHPLAWLGYPVGRALQKRFARDSKQAMVRAAGPG